MLGFGTERTILRMIKRRNVMRNLFTAVLLLLFSVGQANAQLSVVEFMYNNPGEDLYEYIKIQNTSSTAVDLSNFSMDSGLEATFPNIQIPPSRWFYVVVDSARFAQLPGLFGEAVIQADGALNNGGETIRIINANGQAIDEFTYDDGNGWPTFADGNGPALQFCGSASGDKNDPDAWQVSFFPLGVEVDGQPLYGEIGDLSVCGDRGRVSFFSNNDSFLESDGVINIPLYINVASLTEVNVSITANNGSTDVSDFNLITSTFVVDSDTTVNVQLEILEDADLEMDEELTLSFDSFTDFYWGLTNETTITIIDNDTPLTEDLILTGVWDAQPGFSGTKGAEFFAVNDIPDLSVYGVGVVNNGNGTDGVEYTFPAQSLAAGSFIYLVEDSVEFSDYYGLSTSFIFPSINVNGDDAIELFENAQPLDVFGDVDMDGTGTTWEYLDGWAYRNSGTGPDGNTFLVGNWSYGGIDALDGPSTNNLAPSPFPIGTYSTVAPTLVTANDDMFNFDFGPGTVELNVLANDQVPGGVTELLLLGPPNADIMVTDSNTIIVVIDDQFCGSIDFGYSVSNGSSQDDAQVFITVACQAEFPLLDIGIVTTEDAMGIADSIGTTCELIGTVYGVNLTEPGVLFTIIDNDRNGIAVFNNDPNITYTVAEGDEVSIRGEITQFNGLTEIIAEEIELLSSGNQLLSPALVTGLGEDTESQLVQITGVMYTDITEWGGGNSGFNFTVTDGTNDFEVRIDNNVDLFLLPAPGDMSTVFNITGIGGQFDNTTPLDDGYQLFPRYESDIEIASNSTLSVLNTQIDMYPNPVARTLNISTEESLDMVRLIDALGRVVFVQDNPSQHLEIQVSNYSSGIYSVECIKENAHLTMKLIIQ